MAEVAPGTSKIFVRYRNAKPSEDEMREIFSKHGTITDVKLYAKFCFVEYDSETAAQEAIAAENGTVFKDVALEVETVVRNVQKRKPDETDVKVSASTAVASESQETLSANVTVKKLKQEGLLPDVLTRDLSLNEATDVKTAIVAENALNDEECQVMAEKSKDVSNNNKIPNLGDEPPQLSHNQQRRARAQKQKAEADKKTLPQRQNLSPENVQYPKMSSQSVRTSPLRSKSKDRRADWKSEDKLSSADARHSSSASRSYSDHLTNSYDPYARYPDYASISLPPANSHQYTSTIHNWSSYLPAGQNYITAYPLPIYSSNYTAKCSQVSASGASTSYYGSRETTDRRSGEQTDQSRLTQSHRAVHELHGLQESYSVHGDPSSSGKTDQLDRPQLPDLVNYSSMHSDAKPLASDLKSRELKDPGYGSAVESYRTSSPRATTSSARVSASVAESQGHQRSDSVNDSSGICELIITEPCLRQYGLKVASKIHSTGLKVEICDLPNGMTILEEVEDAMMRGRLFAIIISERHVEHNSVTVDILHGVAEEHRNMLLDDAVRLISKSYQDYMAAKQAGAKSGTALELSKETSDFVAPDKRSQALIMRLARNQHLSCEELEEIIVYLKQRQEGLRKESNVLGSLPDRNTALPKKESEDLKMQRNLEATIFSILKGEAPTQQQSTSAKPTHPSSCQPPGRYVESGELYASTDYRRY